MPDQTVKFDDEDVPDREVRAEVEKANVPTRRDKAALSMALAGASNAEIAEQLDYASPAHARAAWEGLLAKSYDHEKDTAAFRSMQSARLNRMLKTLSGIAFQNTIETNERDEDGQKIKVVNPRQLDALRLFGNTVESLSKLHGVEAPKVLAMVTPDAKQFQHVVQAVAESIKTGVAVEGDIFDEDIIDAEVVEDE